MEPLNVLMVSSYTRVSCQWTIWLTTKQVGTGEYTTGFVGGGASGSDKKVGVVGLTLFDLRRRGKVGKLSMAGVNGTKYPAIRKLQT
jgi:D-galacturonate reductase